MIPEEEEEEKLPGRGMSPRWIPEERVAPPRINLLGPDLIEVRPILLADGELEIEETGPRAIRQPLTTTFNNIQYEPNPGILVEEPVIDYNLFTDSYLADVTSLYFSGTNNRTSYRIRFDVEHLQQTWNTIFRTIGPRKSVVLNPLATTIPNVPSSFNTPLADTIKTSFENKFPEVVFPTLNKVQAIEETQIFGKSVNPMIACMNYTNNALTSFTNENPDWPEDLWSYYRAIMTKMYKALLVLSREYATFQLPILNWDITPYSVSGNYYDHLIDLCWRILENVTSSAREDQRDQTAQIGVRFIFNIVRRERNNTRGTESDRYFPSSVLGLRFARSNNIDYDTATIPPFGNDYLIINPTTNRRGETAARIINVERALLRDNIGITYVASKNDFRFKVGEFIDYLQNEQDDEYKLGGQIPNADQPLPIANEHEWLKSFIRSIQIHIKRFTVEDNALTVRHLSLSNVVTALDTDFFDHNFSWPTFLSNKIHKFNMGWCKSDNPIYVAIYKKRELKGHCVRLFMFQLMHYCKPRIALENIVKMFKNEYELLENGCMTLLEVLTLLTTKYLLEFHILHISNDWASYKYYKTPNTSPDMPVAVIVDRIFKPNGKLQSDRHIGFSTDSEISEIKHILGETLAFSAFNPTPIYGSTCLLKTYKLDTIYKNKDYSKEIIQVFMDIETYTDKNRDPYCVCAIIVDSYKKEEIIKCWGEDCVDQFIVKLYDYIRRLPCKDSKGVTFKYTQPVKIWAHNGAKFDFIYLLKSHHIRTFEISGGIHDIKNMNWTYEHYDEDMEPIYTDISTYDFFLTMSRSLSSLAILFGTTNKMDNKHVLNSDPLYILDHQKEIEEYCLNDCRVLQEVIHKFRCTIRGIQLTVDKNVACPMVWISAASLADKIYRSTFLYKDENFKSISPEELRKQKVWGLPRNVYNMVNEFYTGGLTMVFAPVMATGYCYDINSSYPFEMLKNIPIRLVSAYQPITFTTKFVSPPQTRQRLWILTSFAYPTNTFMPCIPVKTKSGNIYPLSGGATLVWHETLEYSISALNLVAQIEGFIDFECFPIYKSWVECFYQRKSESIGAERELYKLFLNSLYGKTGQKEFMQSRFFRDPVQMQEFIVDNTRGQASEKEIKTIRKIVLHGVDMSRRLTPQEPCYEVKMGNIDITPKHIGSLVFIASFITSSARLHLIKTIDRIRSLRGTVYYCDTDSIFTNIELPEDMVSALIIGKWKLEKKITKARFWGSKCYIYEDDTGKVCKRLKGIPYQAIPEDKDLWILDENAIETTIAVTWRRLWGYVENIPMVKKIRTTLTRRVYDNINNSSKPFNSVKEFLSF